MPIDIIIALVEFLLLGLCVGFFAGMFGIGGGMVFVPIATTYLISIGIETELALKTAIASSMATIMFTSVSSGWTHFRLGNVLTSELKWMIPGLIVGVYIGANLVDLADAFTLSVLISTFLMASAVQLYFNIYPRTERELSAASYLAFGSVFGTLSSIFGIGGGSFVVPFLRCLNKDIKKSIGTSACCGIPIAIFGTISYSIVTDTPASLPAFSFGYVVWPMALVTAVASIPAAKVGAIFTTKISQNAASKLFAGYSFVIALYMLFLGITSVA